MSDDPAAAVLHVCTRYLRGGSERRVLDAMRATPHLAHDLVVGRDSDIELARQQLPVRTVTVDPYLVREVDPKNDARALVSMTRRLRAGRYSIVMTHQSKAGVVGRAAAVLAGRLPVVHSLSMAGFGPGYSKVSSSVFRTAERLLGPFTTAYAVVGDDLAARYRQLGIRDEKLRIVRSGVPIPPAEGRAAARARVEAAHGCRPGASLVLFAGSLDARKGVLHLPELLRSVRGDGVDTQLVIAGSGALEADVRTSVRDLGLEAECFLPGHVSPLGDLLLAADVVVLPSSAEGISQVLIQAAAVGTPFVSFDVDGSRELLALGASGTVVPLGDVAGAAIAVAAFCRSGERGIPLDTAPWQPEAIAAGYRSILEAACGRAA